MNDTQHKRLAMETVVIGFQPCALRAHVRFKRLTNTPLPHIKLHCCKGYPRGLLLLRSSIVALTPVVIPMARMEAVVFRIGTSFMVPHRCFRNVEAMGPLVTVC